MLRKLLILQAILALCLFSKAAFSESFAMTPENIRSTLLNGSDDDIEHLATELGLMAPNGNIDSAKKNVPCDAYDKVDIFSANLIASEENVVLQASSSICYYSYLIILKKESTGTWSYVATAPLFARTNVPSISFDELISKGSHEIVVENNQEDYGTGIQQYDFTIFRLTPSGLRVILNEPSKIVFAIPIRDAQGKQANSEQEELTTFRIVEADGKGSNTTGLKDIESKQVLTDHQTQIIRYWRYYWVPELGIFERVSFWPAGHSAVESH